MGLKYLLSALIRWVLILPLLSILLSSCAWWPQNQADTAWGWCFDFSQRGKTQYPFCGYDERDCNNMRQRMLNSRHGYGLRINSKCYYKESE